MHKRDPVLRVAVIGGAVYDADEGADHLAELLLSKDSGATSQFGGGNSIEVELGDDAEVIPAASESPVEVGIGVCPGCDNGTTRSHDLRLSELLNRMYNAWLSYREALDVIASPTV
jgi:hypothetical protein